VPDHPLTIKDAAAALRDGSTTSVALTEHCIKMADRFDPDMGTYLARFDDTALNAAAQADADFAAGVDRGPLQGVPLGIKDIIATDEGPTTAQSLILDPAWGAKGDAPVIARLRAAGAVITGKSTTMEFACGMPDPTKPFPVPRNPWDLARWPGGSSSGTGSGVAAGLFLGGLGTDTGGSIRCPASFCGISGMKQTFGLVPKTGCTALGTSLDHIGPMARSAWDCAAMLGVMAGPHPSDITTVDVAVPDYVAALTGSVEGLRIGVDRGHTLGRAGADPAAERLFEAALEVFAAAGATIVEIDIPLYDELTDCTMLTMPAEVFAYHRADLQRRWADYGAGTRMSMITGALISAGDFQRAQRVRQAARELILPLFDDVAVFVTPTALTGAPLVDDFDVASLIGMLHTPTWNAVGFPALSVPMGLGSEGTPIGLQVIGKPFDDALVLSVGDAYQQKTDHHLQLPPLVAGT
jgi:aspartyl-tRNA(Asn)/glutamyl-tRNA(Gln) amidotransferase subunit A